jgi:hypothetical protein
MRCSARRERRGRRSKPGPVVVGGPGWQHGDEVGWEAWELCRWGLALFMACERAPLFDAWGRSGQKSPQQQRTRTEASQRCSGHGTGCAPDARCQLPANWARRAIVRLPGSSLQHLQQLCASHQSARPVGRQPHSWSPAIGRRLTFICSDR